MKCDRRRDLFFRVLSRWARFVLRNNVFRYELIIPRKVFDKKTGAPSIRELRRPALDWSTAQELYLVIRRRLARIPYPAFPGL